MNRFVGLTVLRRAAASRLSALLVAVVCQAPFGSAIAAGESHALVIGLDDYVATIDGLPRLKHAKADAEGVAQLLSEKGFNVVTLINDRAKRDDIILQLIKYARTLDPEDKLIVYFAGHGIRQTYGGRSYSYWMTYDALIPRLEVEGIRLNHLLEYVMDIPAGKRMVVLDHCHSGSIDFDRALAGTGRDAADGLRIRRDVFSIDNFRQSVNTAVQAGIVILGAATNIAYEYPDLGHGLFTHTFLEALRTNEADSDRNGVLNTDELRSYVIKRTKELAEDRNSVQEPIEFVHGNPSWNLALLTEDTPFELLDQLAEHLETDIELRIDEALEKMEDGSATSVDEQIVAKLRELFASNQTNTRRARSITRMVRRLQ